MILHLDADAFFASVEQALDPTLRGKPMAVGGERRGIIASASYEARKFGVYTPMPSAKARQLCPELIIVPGDFARYRQFSDRMFELAQQFTPWIERSSIDEGYFDCSGLRTMSPRAVAEALQREIFLELGITVSLGIGANKLISQIASKLRKPNAIVEVTAGTEQEILRPLGSHWLPGVGEKLGSRLAEVGLSFIHQVADAPLEFLAQVAGNYAPQLQAYARGIDSRPVDLEPSEAKSYGMQETFDDNVMDREVLLARLRIMADELMHKVRRDGKAIRTLTIYLRHSDMSEVSHGTTMPQSTDLETDLYPLLPRLLSETWTRRASAIRLVGLRLSNPTQIEAQTELALESAGVPRSKQQQVAQLLDAMRARSLPLVRGHSVAVGDGTTAKHAKNA